MSRDYMLIGAIIFGIFGVSTGLLLPPRVGIIIQEMSSLAIFIPILYFSSKIKVRNRVFGNVVFFVSCFFLVAITISLIGTLKLFFLS